eukprot:356404-Chlamydomonas_euryale.AAC.4
MLRGVDRARTAVGGIGWTQGTAPTHAPEIGRHMSYSPGRGTRNRVSGSNVNHLAAVAQATLPACS